MRMIVARTTPTSFSKTKMCKFNILGKCTRGAECVFAHSADELQVLPDLSRTKMCKTLLFTGCCEDKNCTYAHNRKELRQADAVHAAQCAPAASSLVFAPSMIGSQLLAEPEDPRLCQLAGGLGGEFLQQSALNLAAQSLNSDFMLWSAAAPGPWLAADWTKQPSDECETSSGNEDMLSSFSEESVDVTQDDDTLRISLACAPSAVSRSPMKLGRSADGDLLRKPALKLVRSADGALCAMDDADW